MWRNDDLTLTCKLRSLIGSYVRAAAVSLGPLLYTKRHIEGAKSGPHLKETRTLIREKMSD